MSSSNMDMERRVVHRLASVRSNSEIRGTDQSAYERRLSHELESIRDEGLEPFIATATELVDYARSQDILVGPGRRAAPSSLVLYLLGVTGLDPVANGLVFERWLTDPVIEIDVEWHRREQLLEYMRRRYGSGLHGISILGMKQLSTIAETHRRIQSPCRDHETTMQLFRSGATEDVFQFSARAMRNALVEAQPQSRTDLLALNAAFRPAFLTNGVFEELVRRMTPGGNPTLKQPGPGFPEDGLCEVEAIKDVLAETYGLMLFQEQFIEIVHRLSGWSYRESEQYRRRAKAAGDKPDLEDELIACAELNAAISEQHYADLRAMIPRSQNTILKSHVAAYVEVGWMQAELKALDK